MEVPILTTSSQHDYVSPSQPTDSELDRKLNVLLDIRGEFVGIAGGLCGDLVKALGVDERALCRDGDKEEAHRHGIEITVSAGGDGEVMQLRECFLVLRRAVACS